jgi:NAD dependent epimerase/dehydratase
MRGAVQRTEWHGRRVVVTGAGGFIGSHLVERLVERGAIVTAVVRYTSSGSMGWLDHSSVREQIQAVAADITDARPVGRAIRGADTVFHLAALIGIPYSYVAPDSYVRTNIGGTATVLNAALEAGVRRLVHTSTSEVYGTACFVPIHEDHPIQAQSPYSATKAGADLLAWSYHRSFGLPVATVRPFNTYGPRQTARAVIPTIISQALRSNEVRLGDLAPTRDFTYVTDTVDGFLAVASADDAVGAVVNIGSGTEVSVGELAQMIVSATNPDARVVLDQARVRPRESEVERLCADTTRARRLGWTPAHDLPSGLQRTIAWVREHLDTFGSNEYRV